MPREPSPSALAEDGQQVDPIGFLLLPQFPIYALILALESLRLANQNSGRRLFSTHLFGLDGAAVAAGNGMEPDVLFYAPFAAAPTTLTLSAKFGVEVTALASGHDIPELIGMSGACSHALHRLEWRCTPTLLTPLILKTL
jgi:transcriptional regulator GlxA family with amidase domain